MMLNDLKHLDNSAKTFGADGTQNTRNVPVISENAHSDTGDI